MKNMTIRKRTSEQMLKQLNVRVNVHLALSVNEQEVTVRTKEEIVDRLIALTIVSAKALGAPTAKMEQFIKAYNAHTLFTAKERTFMLSKAPTRHEMINYSWTPECVWVLLWSLQLTEELHMPINLCDADFIFETVLRNTKESLLQKAKVRSVSAILDELDFIYRAHWAAKEAILKQQEAVFAFDCGIVYERHHTFNWLVNFMDTQWDDVPTHT